MASRKQLRGMLDRDGFRKMTQIKKASFPLAPHLQAGEGLAFFLLFSIIYNVSSLT